MLGSLLTFLTVFAQNPPAGAKGEPSPIFQFAPYLAVPLIIWLVMMRPAQQQEKKRRELLDKVKKNDKVLTASGIYGTVVSVDEAHNRVQLRLDDDGKVKATFTKASIVQIFNESIEKSAEAK
jgi:preprotein translocase subunit YajC